MILNNARFVALGALFLLLAGCLTSAPGQDTVTGDDDDDGQFATPEHAGTAAQELVGQTNGSVGLFAFDPATAKVGPNGAVSGPGCPTISGDTSDPDGDGIPTDVLATYDAVACRATAPDGDSFTYEGTISLQDTTVGVLDLGYAAVMDLTYTAEGPAQLGTVTQAATYTGFTGARQTVDAVVDRQIDLGTPVSSVYTRRYHYLPDVAWQPGDALVDGFLLVGGDWDLDIDGSFSVSVGDVYSVPWCGIAPACDVGKNLDSGGVGAAFVEPSGTAHVLEIQWTGCGATDRVYDGSTL